jgi:hypothetical protein
MLRVEKGRCQKAEIKRQKHDRMVLLLGETFDHAPTYARNALCDAGHVCIPVPKKGHCVVSCAYLPSYPFTFVLPLPAA